jgi:hypothetical protein
MADLPHLIAGAKANRCSRPAALSSGLPAADVSPLPITYPLMRVRVGNTDGPVEKGHGKGDPREETLFLLSIVFKADADQLRQSTPSGQMRRPLPTPDVGRARLRAAGRLRDLGQLHESEPRQNLPPEQLRVVDRPGIGLVPVRQRPLTGRDRATPDYP